MWLIFSREDMFEERVGEVVLQTRHSRLPLVFVQNLPQWWEFNAAIGEAEGSGGLQSFRLPSCLFDVKFDHIVSCLVTYHHFFIPASSVHCGHGITTRAETSKSRMVQKTACWFIGRPNFPERSDCQSLQFVGTLPRNQGFRGDRVQVQGAVYLVFDARGGLDETKGEKKMGRSLCRRFRSQAHWQVRS